MWISSRDYSDCSYYTTALRAYSPVRRMEFLLCPAMPLQLSGRDPAQPCSLVPSLSALPSVQLPPGAPAALVCLHHLLATPSSLFPIEVRAPLGPAIGLCPFQLVLRDGWVPSQLVRVYYYNTTTAHMYHISISIYYISLLYQAKSRLELFGSTRGGQS